MVASVRRVFFQIEGHNEAQCSKKRPEKAPEWWRERNAKAQSATSSMEICLMSLGNIDDGGGDNSDYDTSQRM